MDDIVKQLQQKIIEDFTKNQDQIIMSKLLSDRFDEFDNPIKSEKKYAYTQNNILNDLDYDLLSDTIIIDSLPMLEEIEINFNNLDLISNSKKIHYKKPLVLSNIDNNTEFKYNILYDYDYSSVYWSMGLCTDTSYEEEYYEYIEKNIYNIDNEISDIVGYKFNTEQMIFNNIKIDKEKELNLSNNSNKLYNKLRKLFDIDYFKLKIVYGHKLINILNIDERKMYRARKYDTYYFSGITNNYYSFLNFISIYSIIISLDAAYEIISKHKNLSIDYSTIKFINNKMIYYISDNIYVITDGSFCYIFLDNNKKCNKINIPKFNHKEIKNKNKLVYPKNKR